MRLLRVVKLAALAIVLSAAAVVAGASVYLRIEQHRFRKQAEQLLSDLRDLELTKADTAQANAVLRKWAFEEWGQGPGKPCTEDGCIYHLQLVPKTDGRIFSNPFAPTLLIFPLEWLGSRPTVVHAQIEIRKKALTSLSFSVWTVGRGCEGRGRVDCTLMGYADFKQRGSGWSSHQQPDVKLTQYLLHPSYLVGAFPEWLNADTGGSPSVIIWAEFLPDGNAADMTRLMQFDMSCITKLLSCKERDLMPDAWAQSVKDARQSPKVLTCTSELSERVARLADAIAVIRPKTVELSPPPYEGRSPRLRDLEIINVIRKPEDEFAPPLANINVDKPEMMTTADTRSPLVAGQEYVFLLQVHNTPEIGWIALYPCGVLTLSDANLKMVTAAAYRGAD